MQHRRRRNRDFRRAGGDRFQEFEIGALNRFRVAHLARDVHDRRLEIDVALRAVKLDVDAALRLDAFELREEIDMEVRAAKFAVRDPAQSQILLKLDDAANRFIFDAAQLRSADAPLLELLACVEQEFRPQKTADVIGAKWRCAARAHDRLRQGRAH